MPDLLCCSENSIMQNTTGRVAIFPALRHMTNHIIGRTKATVATMIRDQRNMFSFTSFQAEIYWGLKNLRICYQGYLSSTKYCKCNTRSNFRTFQIPSEPSLSSQPWPIQVIGPINQAQHIQHYATTITHRSSFKISIFCFLRYATTRIRRSSISRLCISWIMVWHFLNVLGSKLTKILKKQNVRFEVGGWRLNTSSNFCTHMHEFDIGCGRTCSM